MVREFQNSVSGNSCRGMIFIQPFQACPFLSPYSGVQLQLTNEKSCSRKRNPVFSVNMIFVNTINADNSTIGAVVCVFVT
jgi:hypothetical protein